jgi:hypothetical protein
VLELIVYFKMSLFLKPAYLFMNEVSSKKKSSIILIRRNGVFISCVILSSAYCLSGCMSDVICFCTRIYILIGTVGM